MAEPSVVGLALSVLGILLLGALVCFVVIGSAMVCAALFIAYGIPRIVMTLFWTVEHRRHIALTLLSTATVAGIAVWQYYFYWSGNDIPEAQQMIRYMPAQIGYVYDNREQSLIELGTTFRKPVNFDDIPVVMEHAFVAAEDKNFYEHDGVDWPVLLLRVPVRNFFAWATRGRMQFVQGGSTLTMQLVRNHYLHDWLSREDRPELLVDTLLTRQIARFVGIPKTNRLMRKAREIKYALHLERQLRNGFGKAGAKQLLLSRYLSTVYFGYSMYGPDTATRFYFNTDMENLKPHEAAFLASVVPAPSRFAVLADSSEVRDSQKRRRDAVLRRMGEKGFLQTAASCRSTERADCHDEVAYWSSLPVSLIGRLPGSRTEAPAGVQAALDELERAGFPSSAFHEGQLHVHTTLNVPVQRVVNAAAALGADTYRTHYAHEPEPPQVAVVVLRNRDAAILALYGGNKSPDMRHTWTWLDRSRKSWRQPGSAFKLFVYLAALSEGTHTVDSFVNDSPMSLRMGNGSYKSIGNYDGTYKGLISYREAFAQSRNIPAMRIARDVAGLDAVINTAYACGITTSLRREPSTALGANDLTLIELTEGFRTVISDGIASDPFVIARINNPIGEEVYRHSDGTHRAPFSHAALRGVQELMRSGVRLPNGTGRGINLPDIPLMCKTGTTNDFADARIVCGTWGPNGITVGVWVGFDDYGHSLGDKATGGRLALPVARAIFKGVYTPGVLGAAPSLPANIEESIDRYLARWNPEPVVERPE
jgi:membrane peptidoglycan carboxypeptidase